WQCPGPPFRLFLRHVLDDDQTDTALHLELVQRVLAPFGFSFWFFDLATSIKTRSGGNQGYGGLPLSFLYVWHSGHSNRSLAGLQCSGLGRVFVLLCRRHFSTGHRHFAICSDDSSAASRKRDLDSPMEPQGMEPASDHRLSPPEAGRNKAGLTVKSPLIRSHSGALRTSCLSASPESYLIKTMQPAEALSMATQIADDRKR